jgi:hypothetical protein
MGGSAGIGVLRFDWLPQNGQVVVDDLMGRALLPPAATGCDGPVGGDGGVQRLISDGRTKCDDVLEIGEASSVPLGDCGAGNVNQLTVSVEVRADDHEQAARTENLEAAGIDRGCRSLDAVFLASGFRSR